MIKEFKAGKWYVYEGTERPVLWNMSGKMDWMLDGLPHKCIGGEGDYATFEDDDYLWGWDIENFREVSKKDMVEMMKEMKGTQVKETPKYKSLSDALNDGFWGYDNGFGRYLLVCSGTARNLAVRPRGTWTDKEGQKQAFMDWQNGDNSHEFIRFDTEKELYQWLLEGED